MSWTVTYDGNGSTGGSAPVDPSSPYTDGDTVTVLSQGSLVKTGDSFAGWNTQADGRGDGYLPGQDFIIYADTTLYAQWSSSPPADGTEGVSIALGGNALDPTSTWVRVDNVQNVNVAGIRVKRGRPDERSKTTVGTAEISGFDMIGQTDPTNTTGPWYGKLDPVNQATVNLWNPVAEEWSPIFTGYTEDWAHVLDVSERVLDFTLTMSDMLDMLNAAEIIPDRAGNTVPGESKGDVSYDGSHVDDRLYAALADASTALLEQTWPASLLHIFSGNVFVQNRIYANRTTLLQVIDEACDAESPGTTNRFIGWDGVLNFRGRDARYQPGFYTSGDGNSGHARTYPKPILHWRVGDHDAASTDDTIVIPTEVEFTRGLTNLINASLVTPLGIADADIGAQFVYDKRSVGQYGPRTEGTSYENIIVGDGNDGNNPYQESKSYGEATVDNYKKPVNRVKKLVFRNPPAGASANRKAATWNLLTQIELSDTITVTTTHPGGGGFNHVKHFVEGITYDIKPLNGDEWDVTLTLDLSPAVYFDAMPNTWSPNVGSLLASFTPNDRDDPSSLTGPAPLSVSFDSSASVGAVSYLWDFGDGSTSTSANPTHSFGLGGRTVRLTVTGSGGETSSACCYVEAT